MKNSRSTYYTADQDITFKMISPEEEIRIFKSGQAGNEADRTFFIHNHLLFAMMEAERNCHGYLDREDYASAANMAIMKAMQRFDPTKARFTTYLRPFIRGEVMATWKSKFNGKTPDPSLGGSFFRLGENTNANVVCRGAADVGTDEFSDRRESPERSIVENNDEISVNHEGEEFDLRDCNRAALALVLSKCSKSDQELLKLHYVDEIELCDIARMRGVGRQAVSIAHKRLLERLKKALETKIEEVL